MKVYTIGIKRRFWFGYKLFAVTKHQTITALNQIPIRPRFEIELADGSMLVIPEIDRRQYYVGADFWEASSAPLPAEEIQPDGNEIQQAS